MTNNLSIHTMRPKMGELKMPPLVRVYIKSCTSDKTDEKGLCFITSKCINESEIDYEINRLIKELEELRKIGKRIIRKGA